MDFKTIVTTLAQADNAGTISPLSALDIVRLAELLAEPEPIRIRDHADLVALAMNSHEVMQELANGRKIGAIKALRTATEGVEIDKSMKGSLAVNFVGLRAAKEAVEAIPASALPASTLCLYCGTDLDFSVTWADCPSNRHNHRA